MKALLIKTGSERGVPGVSGVAREVPAEGEADARGIEEAGERDRKAINMPLKPGASNIGANIRELQEHGTRPRSKKQILAISLRVAGVPRKGSLKQMGSGKYRA